MHNKLIENMGTELQKIKELVHTCEHENIVLAKMLVSSQGIDFNVDKYLQGLRYLFCDTNKFLDPSLITANVKLLDTLTHLTVTGNTGQYIKDMGGNIAKSWQREQHKPYMWKKIPEQISMYKNLSSIALDELNINTLPAELLNMQTLEQISLANCRHFRAFPENIDLAQNLSAITWRGCSIKELPDTIAKLSKLRQLGARGGDRYTGLQKLPENIGDSKSLKRIVLCDTELKTLPESIVNLDLDILSITSKHTVRLSKKVKAWTQTLKKCNISKYNVRQMLFTNPLYGKLK